MIISSPLERAVQTAAIISSQVGYSYNTQFNDNLQERDCGKLSGMNNEDIRSQFPEFFEKEKEWKSIRDPIERIQYRDICQRGHYLKYGMETDEMMMDRCKIFLEYIDANYSEFDGDIITVTHGGMVNAFMKYFSNSPIDVPKRKIIDDTGNCTISMIKDNKIIMFPTNEHLLSQ